MTNASASGSERAPAVDRRVAIVEDHQMVSDVMAEALGREPGLRLVGTAAALAGAVPLARSTRPDLVVLDAQLPDARIADSVPALLAEVASARILVVTGWPSEQDMLAAFSAGANGYLAKAHPLPLFLDAVRRVLAGDTVVDPTLLPRLVTRAGGEQPGQLTLREIRVLDLLAGGAGTADIAAALHVSTATVRNIVAAVMAKLGVHTRLDAVREAVARGLVSPHLAGGPGRPTG